MSKHSLTKFYRDRKESLQKKTRDSNHSLSKEEKKQQYRANDTKMFQKTINKSWLRIERNIIKC